MRIKLTLAIVVGLLFCALVIREIPELINLVDDTSNDFSLVVFAKDALKVVKIQILPPGQPVFADIQCRQAALCFPTHPLIQTFQTPDDVLHVSCVLRT
ncbi:MAG: hypothetical protein WAK24_05190 [Candidatus Acidiferrales bacterium]